MAREVRRGPLRRRLYPALGGGEMLSCGHIAPLTAVDMWHGPSARPGKRRCAQCPASPRTEYYRAYEANHRRRTVSP